VYVSSGGGTGAKSVVTDYKGKVFPYSLSSVGPGADPGVQAVSPQVTISHPPVGRLPLLSARPAITFPVAEHRRPMAGTRLYCLVTETYGCEQLAQGCYAAFAPRRICTHDLLMASPTLYPLRHHATSSSSNLATPLHTTQIRRQLPVARLTRCNRTRVNLVNRATDSWRRICVVCQV